MCSENSSKVNFENFQRLLRTKYYIKTQKRSFASQILARTRQKAALLIAIKKVEISFEFINTQLRHGFDLRPRDYKSHALTTQPRTLIKSQILATNKAENRCYEISMATDSDYRKSAAK